jgi:hypothetical protein
VNNEFREVDSSVAYDEEDAMAAGSTTASKMMMSEVMNHPRWEGLFSYYTNLCDDYYYYDGGDELHYYGVLHNMVTNDLVGASYVEDDDRRNDVLVNNDAAAA